MDSLTSLRPKTMRPAAFLFVAWTSSVLFIPSAKAEASIQEATEIYTIVSKIAPAYSAAFKCDVNVNHVVAEKFITDRLVYLKSKRVDADFIVRVINASLAQGKKNNIEYCSNIEKRFGPNGSDVPNALKGSFKPE